MSLHLPLHLPLHLSLHFLLLLLPLLHLVSPMVTVSPPATLPPEKCSSPRVHLNGSRLRLGHRRHARTYIFQVPSPGTEPQFCKLLCQSGSWRGPHCAGDPDTIPDSQFQLGCWLDYQPKNLEIRLGHQVIVLNGSQQFPHSTNLLMRCDDMALAMDGDGELVCQDGSWSAPLPACRQTSTKKLYSDSRPPRVRPVVEPGPLVRGRLGEILVRIGSAVHLNCVQDRTKGSPQWSWSNSDREYTTGWAIIPRKRNWFYRLDILSADVEDSGTYNCTNQRGLTNTVRISVSSLTCPVLKLPPDVRTNSSQDFLGTQVLFSCAPGFLLEGAPASSCRDDGTWSSPPPSCSPGQCQALEIASQHLRVLTLNNSYMGQATFDCPFGYQLIGDPEIRCLASCSWSSPVPSCRPILCAPPPPPSNGHMIATGEHYVGSVVQFSCQSGFVLVGEPVIRCTDEGLWSHSTPKCQRACRYPGAPPGGVVTPVSFLYSVGDTISVVCHHGYLVTGSSKVHCTEQGEWSSPVLPTCTNYLE